MSDERGEGKNFLSDTGKAINTAAYAKQTSEAVKAAAHSAKAAQSAAGVAVTAGSSAGAATGTAVAGPLGTVIGAVVTSKTFWKVVVGIVVANFLFLYICVNIIPITMSYLGFSDANDLVDSKNSQNMYSIKSRMEEIFEKVDGSEEKIRKIVSSQRDKVRAEIEKDWKENHSSCEHLTVLDEYETLMSREFTTYLSYMLMNVWDSTVIQGFTFSGEDDYATQLTSPYDDIFREASKKYHVSFALLKAVGKVESNFNPQSHSSAGAMGVMQLMPQLCEELGVSEPYNPQQNIMAGARYLASHIEAFKAYDNGMELAVAAYNAGGGAVKRAGHKIPDITETKNYVKKVFSYLTPQKKFDSKTDYEALWKQVRTAVEENKQDFFDYGFIREEIAEDNTKAACYNLILGDILERKQQGGFSYSLCMDEETFEIGIQIVKAAVDGVEAVWSVLDRLGDWMGKILDFFSGDGEDAKTDTKGDVIHYENMESGCIADVTYYNQGEEPWKNMKYGSGTIQSCGCGPTACAIVFSTLLHESVTPEMTCRYAMEHGEYTAGAGTNHSFPANAAAHWKISCRRVKKSEMDTVVKGLKAGGMAVVICAPYTITKSGSGHYITLTGVTNDGKIAIADPGSRERSGKVYTKEQIRAFARDLEGGSIWIMSR